MIYYVATDDVKTTQKMLLTQHNKEFKIVFPGLGNINSPGIKAYVDSMYERNFICLRVAYFVIDKSLNG